MYIFINVEMGHEYPLLDVILLYSSDSPLPGYTKDPINLSAGLDSRGGIFLWYKRGCDEDIEDYGSTMRRLLPLTDIMFSKERSKEVLLQYQ